MNDENYEAIRNQYHQIEESCYRMGIGVDEYYKLIKDGNETLEEHLKKKSELENIIEQNWCD